MFLFVVVVVGVVVVVIIVMFLLTYSLYTGGKGGHQSLLSFLHPFVMI